MKDLAIIILNWNGENDTVECLESIEKNSDKYDIYLLDNGSRDIKTIMEYVSNAKGYAYLLQNTPQPKEGYNLFIILSESNLGFAKGNNYIVNNIKDNYNYVLLLNNDTVVPDDAILSMLTLLTNSDYTGVTCEIRYYYEPAKLWNAGGKFTWYGDRKYYSQRKIDKLKNIGAKEIQAEFITGCAMMLKTEYIREFGLFTEEFFHGEEDFNFCKRVSINNRKLGVDLSTFLYHKVGRTLLREENSNKKLNAMTIFYLNRVIDGKILYSNRKWQYWKNLYLTLVLLRRLKDLGLQNSWALVKRINILANNNDSVNKKLFDNIMNEKAI